MFLLCCFFFLPKWTNGISHRFSEKSVRLKLWFYILKLYVVDNGALCVEGKRIFLEKGSSFFSIHSFELIHSFIHVSYACNSKCIVISMRSVKFKRCCACALRNVDFVLKPFENETKWNTFQLFTFTIVISRRLVLITQQQQKECLYFFVVCEKKVQLLTPKHE